jgi:hypothetical protein
VSGNFRSIVVCDFEYEVATGDLPNVLCMVAHVLDEKFRHVHTIRRWRGEFGPAPPFDIGPDSLDDLLQGAGLEIPDAHLRPEHRLSRRQQYLIVLQSGRDTQEAAQAFI